LIQRTMFERPVVIRPHVAAPAPAPAAAVSALVAPPALPQQTEAERTQLALHKLHVAEQRAAADGRAARFLQLREQGLSAEQAFDEIDRPNEREAS